MPGCKNSSILEILLVETTELREVNIYLEKKGILIIYQLSFNKNKRVLPSNYKYTAYVSWSETKSITI